jgi:tetratricopeptide (TPR) repeat protein
VKLKRIRLSAVVIVLLGAVAFVIGAILTWAMLSQFAGRSPVSRWRTTTNDTERELTKANGPEVTDALPDVSKLIPSQSAVTLGNWYFDHHDWTKAAEQYREAITLGLDNADVRSDLGSALRFNNQPEAAAVEYQIAQRENPEHENSFFNLATLYLQSLNQPDRAIALLEQFKARFPRSGAIPRVDELLQEARKKTGAVPTATPG